MRACGRKQAPAAPVLDASRAQQHGIRAFTYPLGSGCGTVHKHYGLELRALFEPQLQSFSLLQAWLDVQALQGVQLGIPADAMQRASHAGLIILTMRRASWILLLLHRQGHGEGWQGHLQGHDLMGGHLARGPFHSSLT